jgi:hypothetical protein
MEFMVLGLISWCVWEVDIDEKAHSLDIQYHCIVL